METNNYRRLAVTLLISFFIMYGVMFLNVDRPDHIYLSLTRTYMTLLMVSPMAVLMIAMMPEMYMNRRLNMVLVSFSVLVFACSLTCLRTQAFVSDGEYMRAMIPHHSSAIMTSKHALLKDTTVRELSKSIIASQEREIAEMKALLEKQSAR